MAEKKGAKHALEAARAAALAAHSAAGLATTSSMREAARLLRSAEALARSAVAVLAAPRAPVTSTPTSPATAASPSGPPPVSSTVDGGIGKKRRRRRKKASGGKGRGELGQGGAGGTPQGTSTVAGNPPGQGRRRRPKKSTCLQLVNGNTTSKETGKACTDRKVVPASEGRPATDRKVNVANFPSDTPVIGGAEPAVDISGDTIMSATGGGPPQRKRALVRHETPPYPPSTPPLAASPPPLTGAMGSLQGLQSRPDLNDRPVRFLRVCEESGRYIVAVAGQSEPIRINPRSFVLRGRHLREGEEEGD